MNENEVKIQKALQSVSMNSDAGNGLIKRSAESAVIREFLQTGFDQGCGSLYINGSVGSGKSCVVLSEVSLFQKEHPALKVHSVNCASQLDGSIEGFLTWILFHLFSHAALTAKRLTTTASIREYIETHLHKKGEQPVLLVLDEIDDLIEESRGKEVIDWLMKISCLKASHLITIGIGNASYSPPPQIQEEMPIKPHILRFRGYSQQEIQDILVMRNELLAVYQPKVLQYIGTQVERMGGDIRIALTMCREPLIQFFTEGKIEALKFPLSLNHVLPIISQLADDTISKISGLPEQQKLFIASFLIAHSINNAVSRQNLYSGYQILCNKLNLESLSIIVLFRESIGPLVDLNFIHISRTIPDSFELVLSINDVKTALNLSSPSILQVINSITNKI